MDPVVKGWDFMLRLLVMGKIGCGKSCLCYRLVHDKFRRDLRGGGYDMFCRTVDLDGWRIMFQLFHLPGDPSFSLLNHKLFRSCPGVLLVYDITSEDSFRDIETVWLKEIDHYRLDVTKLLVGTKCDLATDRRVDYTRAKEFAERNGSLFIETSAKDGTNVQEAVLKIATEILRKDKRMYAALYAAEGTVKPKIMKICFFFVGSEGAGKTTLMESLKRGLLKALFTWERQPDDPTCEEERTVGINVMTVDVPDVGRFSLWDYGGQKQFHKTHELFFSSSNCFFILLISLVTGEKRQLRSIRELMEEAQYWLAFIRASLREGVIPTVLMAASRGDCCPDGQRSFERVVSYMHDLFAGKVAICSQSFLLDCRKSYSDGMRQLRQFLRTVKEQWDQKEVLYPRLCEPVVTKLLPSLRQHGNPFIKTAELVQTIKEKECPVQKVDILEKVVSFMHDTGEVTCVGDVTALSPVYLSQYAIGPLVAPDDVKWHTVRERNDGTVQ